MNIDDDILRDISRFSTIMLGEDGSELGSGTFVEIDARKGILTASHVAKNINNYHPDINLVIHARYNTGHKIEHKHVHLIGDCNGCPEGPDIAFIELINQSDVSAINASTKVFYNIDKHISDNPLCDSNTLIYICGCPQERTVRREFSNEYEMLMCSVTINNYYRNDGYDYFEFEIVYDNPIKTFEGVSGGGVWLRSDRYGLNLVGVAFYQDIHKDKKIISIRCHAHESIYNKVYSFIKG